MFMPEPYCYVSIARELQTTARQFTPRRNAYNRGGAGPVARPRHYRLTITQKHAQM